MTRPRQRYGVASENSDGALSPKATKNLVCVLQRFFASDIEPFPLDLVRLYWLTRVEPLHEPARLIGVIASCKVRGQKREDRRRVRVKGDCGQGSARRLWFLLQ